MNASVYLNDNVSIGFANSNGNVTQFIMQDKYQIIERMNLKPTIVRPRVRAKQIPDFDMGVFKHVINRRRNATVLKSFIGPNSELQQVMIAQEVEDDCKKMVKNIDEEMSTIATLSKDIKLSRFIRDTKASEEEGIEYIIEFKQDVDKAIKVYQERQGLVRNFSQKFKKKN